MDNNYCTNCDCPACEAARAVESAKKTLDQIVSSWAWDKNPTECAIEMVRLEQYSLDEFLAAMRRTGYDESAIYDVEGAFLALS